MSLKESGIGAISLSSTTTAFNIKGMDNTLHGKISQSGAFLFEDGNVGSVQQVDLAVRKGVPADEFSKNSNQNGYPPLPETLAVQSNIMKKISIPDNGEPHRPLLEMHPSPGLSQGCR